MIFNAEHAAQNDLSAAGMVGLFDAAVAANDAACGKIGTWHHFHDLFDGRRGIFQDEQRRLDQLLKL